MLKYNVMSTFFTGYKSCICQASSCHIAREGN